LAGKYLIYYRKKRGIIHILHVFHGARDQARAFRQQGQ
jgi:plasmid stabilization system protein ParE